MIIYIAAVEKSATFGADRLISSKLLLQLTPAKVTTLQEEEILS